MEQDKTTFWDDLDVDTQTGVHGEKLEQLFVPGLTILAHPDPRRIGERAPLVELSRLGREVPLSRQAPIFAKPGHQPRPLGDSRLSRKPVVLASLPEGGVRVTTKWTRTHVEIDTEPVSEDQDFSAADLERGVVLVLARRIALVLHPVQPQALMDVPQFDLVGESNGIVTVRQEIARMAELTEPVLLLGETGSGKDIVATAIHEASARRGEPFVAVNMGALPSAQAAAELFGSAEGTLTGTDRQRIGYFARADGGTLFLDEIGETPPDVQVMLLRALETGIVQPVGSEVLHQVDVRILAATDADLEAKIEAGRFRAPLLHRLNSYEIRIPPLRDRRDDVGSLLLHFLRQELEALDESWRLEKTDAKEAPWLGAPLVARLATYDWPGNVRQLRNVARQLVVGNRGEPHLKVTRPIEELVAKPIAAGQSGEAPATESVAATPRLTGETLDRPIIKTLLITDLVNSTELFDRLGDQTAYGIVARHDREARRLLADYDGQEVDKSDGFLFLFERPADALGYALEYHEALAELSIELGVELRARAGIHLGEIFVRRNTASEVARGAKQLEVEGLAKPAVARLASLASSGQTLLTRTAFDLARQVSHGDHPLAAPEVHWLPHGDYRFKGIGEPVAVFEVGVEGSAPLTAPTDSAKAVRD